MCRRGFMGKLEHVQTWVYGKTRTCADFLVEKLHEATRMLVMVD